MGCFPVDSCVVGYEGTGGGRAFTDCRVAGARKENESCSDAQRCKRGLGCSGGVCVEYCRRGVTNTCAMGRDCLPLAADPVVIGSTEYGYCHKN
jgi:hypothetical protein